MFLMLNLLCRVQHRIDGLESSEDASHGDICVQHRIDGLEKPSQAILIFLIVQHRIDGLEM